MWRLLVFLAIGVAAGCTVGQVTVKKSQLDNTTYIDMSPVWLIQSVKVGLSWNDKLPADQVTMKVIKTHGGNISDGNSLHVNLDGVLFHLPSIDATPELGYEPGVHNSVADVSGHVWSAKRYVVSPSFLRQLLSARKVVVRLDVGQDFIEEEMRTDPLTFTSMAPDFLKAIESYQQ